jgi:hypothetical protein
MNYVLSVKALQSYWLTVKRASQRVTTIKPTKPKPGETEKKRNKGEQSFADISNNFQAFTGLIVTIGGSYLPSSPDLTVASMTPLKTSLDGQSKTLGEKAGELSVQRVVRINLFNKEDSLRARMNSIKNAVKSQYGSSSPEYITIKGIKN